MHNQFKTQKFKHLMLAMGPRYLNSAPYSPVHCSSHSMTSFQSSELTELPVVENSQLFAQRAHSARYAPLDGGMIFIDHNTCTTHYARLTGVEPAPLCSEHGRLTTMLRRGQWKQAGKQKRGPPPHRLCLLHGDRTHVCGVPARWSICYASATMLCIWPQNHQLAVCFALAPPCCTFSRLSPD